MSRTPVDIDDDTPAFAQRQLGTKPQRETIDRALTTGSAISADDRARALRRLQEDAAAFRDFDALAERERAGL
ncbi:DUF2191 domain-containing protein [Streptomyces sp. NPDC004542]|uniref:DUF2191 domain-containing protein n=1 Tax=Streptomyces sp. NPDC004542 TaxID=3154281 RepID=UPI0033A531A3